MMKKSSIGGLAVALAVVAAGCVSDPKVSVVCLRESHKYATSERAEFDVTSSVPGTPVTVGFSRAYLPPFETIVTTTPARVSCTLGTPGFVVCTAQANLPDGQKGEPVRAGAAFDPQKLHTVLPPPKDYDAFWKRAFAELAAIEPDYRSEFVTNGLQMVSCRTVQGTRLYAFLHFPEGKGPFPFQVKVSGGDSELSPEETIRQMREEPFDKHGFLFIHLPPWAPTYFTQKEAGAYHKTWLKENGCKSWLYSWKSDAADPRDRWYYRCILGSCRMIDLVVADPRVDRARVYYYGASTGGGYGYFLSAFSPHIRAAICEVPNYGNASGPSIGVPSGEDDRGAYWQTSLYYDAAYCAPRITCPMLVTCGYLDFSCAAETIYCSYNALTCRKKMIDRVLFGHGGHPEGYLDFRKKWLAEAIGL